MNFAGTLKAIPVAVTALFLIVPKPVFGAADVAALPVDDVLGRTAAANEESRLKLMLSETQKSLALARSEAEVFRRQSSELKLRAEALGFGSNVEALSRLDQRLLAVVSDLRVVSDEKRELVQAYARLSEKLSLAAGSLGHTHPDLAVRLKQEIESVALEKRSKSSLSNVSRLEDISAISVRDDIGLVVLNAGCTSGVKVGTPFRIMRGNAVVGLLKVVDVREKICGAILQTVVDGADSVKVGDRVTINSPSSTKNF